MKLRYQTGTATLIQFVVLVLLNLVNAVISSVSGCHDGSGCTTSIFTSVVYFLLLALWFGVLLIIGAGAQEKRSKRMCQILIAAEGMVALIALFDLKHYPNIMGLITSLVDALLALWVIILAFRLMRSGGGRIVTSQRARKRRNKSV